tara:strand:+ start:300 stop:788 length:489 start_codon:yes stop_codon:yes gene_type:complete
MSNPWDKETDKERIARLEKEVQELKNNQNKNSSFDDDRIFGRKSSNNGNESFIEKDKIIKKSGIGFMTWIVIIIAVIYVLGNLGDDDKPKTKSYSSSSTQNTTSYHKLKIGDNNKYAICYGQVTKVHKKTGLHENNHSGSVEAKEKICSAYSRGEISDYPRP